MTRPTLKLAILLLLAMSFSVPPMLICSETFANKGKSTPTMTPNDKELAAVPRSEAEWQQRLTPEQYYVLRRKGTERAFTGEYWKTKAKGIYRCAGCGQALFSADHKFDSGTGWPSYWRPIEDAQVTLRADNSWFMRRTEVVCSRCDGHLGHVFSDGPRPTGQRYCINSAALQLEPALDSSVDHE